MYTWNIKDIHVEKILVFKEISTLFIKIIRKFNSMNNFYTYFISFM